MEPALDMLDGDGKVDLVGDDGEVDAFAHVGWGLAEVIHRQAFSWAPVHADAAPYASSLVDDHRGGVLTEFRARHFCQFDVVVNGMDAIGRDHLDAAMRTGVDAAIAKNTAITIDEDVELTLQAALGFFKSDRLGEADFDLKGSVHSADAPIGHGQ